MTTRRRSSPSRSVAYNGALRRMTPKLKPRGLMGRQPLAAILVAASLAFFATLPLAVGQDPSGPPGRLREPATTNPISKACGSPIVLRL